MQFNATKHKVANRGVPPDWFLIKLVEWGRAAAGDIFEPKPDATHPGDVFNLLKPILGPWMTLLQRRAAMLELMRVHAGFESSWHQREGVDVTNRTSMTHAVGQETGIFQVSFDSTYLCNGAMKPFAVEHGIGHVGSFIAEMKNDLQLAFEYYARLVRWSYQWAGPLKRHEVDEWLQPNAVIEFESLLT